MDRVPEQSALYLGARGAPRDTPGGGPLGGLEPLAFGKVRDLYAIDAEHLLFVTTDRVSAFDVVMAEGVPHKGRVLTAIATWWFERTRELVPNHLVSTSVADVPSLSPDERRRLAGRVMVVRRTAPTPVEWVVRGYLAGSGFKEYRESGGLWSQPLPTGLQLASRLPTALLTPTTKDQQHDQPLTLEQARERVGGPVFERAQRASLALFEYASVELAARGLLLADTKFEFGLLGDRLLLIDEALTPDSSRLWPAEDWHPGQNPPSFDKQPLRDWLETRDWNKQPPPPPVDPRVIEQISKRYLELCRRLTGAVPAGA
jgi:phosphoribosylaminoimidazole-succinocarboxamide synthase